MSDIEKSVIYILINKSFPDYIKIGYTYDVDRKLDGLNKAECLPYPYEVYATYHVDAVLEERVVDNAIKTLNPNLEVIYDFKSKTKKIEFYVMKPEKAYTILENIAILSGTKKNLNKVPKSIDNMSGQEILDLIKKPSGKKRPAFSFTNCGIPIGSIIRFVNDLTITAFVIDDRHVMFDEKMYTLSGLATELVRKTGSKAAVVKNGPKYWTYNGKVLDDIRNSLEDERRNS